MSGKRAICIGGILALVGYSLDCRWELAGKGVELYSKLEIIYLTLYAEWLL